MIDFRGLFQLPAVTFLHFGLNHSIHHRGQLSMYLRPMGAKVPAIYGESYDSAKAQGRRMKRLAADRGLRGGVQPARSRSRPRRPRRRRRRRRPPRRAPRTRQRRRQVARRAAPRSSSSSRRRARTFPPQTEKPVMDQAGLTFGPELLLVRTGQPVEFRNSDDTLHNVRVSHEETRTSAFNVAIPTGESYTYTFERDGFYRVGCDIHPAMAASVFAAVVAVHGGGGRATAASRSPTFRRARGRSPSTPTASACTRTSRSAAA